MSRDHHVPQFLLRNFQIPEQPGLIYSYKRNLRPRPLSIRNIAQEENYYDLRDSSIPLPVDNVDALLRTSENDTSPIIEALLTASSFSPSPEEFGQLIWFLALLAFRTPLAREETASIHTAITSREFKKFAEDKGAFLKLDTRECDEATLKLKEQARQALLNGDIKLSLKRGDKTEDYLMGLQLAFVQKLAPILGRKYWHIIETGNLRPFLISDHPAVRMPSPRYRAGMPLRFAEEWVLFPISPRRPLLLTNKRYSKQVLTITEAKMMEYQWYIITGCYKSVFSHMLNAEFQDVLNTTKEGETIVEPSVDE